MADPKGFLRLERVDPPSRPVEDRIRDWAEIYEPLPETTLKTQAARCMDCGVSFCQGDTGCPVQNLIPEWNELIQRDRWREALRLLHLTNSFPEFTGRLCPAPCEGACVLGIIGEPVSIKTIEQSIIDRGFAEGWVVPRPPLRETGRRVAIIGSGPAGLAAAQRLRRSGHTVDVFEKDDRIGGLLRYGIPDFKMEKSVLDRRIDQLIAEGVRLHTGVEVGTDLPVDRLRSEYEAVLLAAGAQRGRDMEVPGRELGGVHFAMDYLVQQNRRLAGDEIPPAEAISAHGRRVVVIGGGDTGSDCIGTAHRQGATEVIQLALYPPPPTERDASTPWPFWPLVYRESHAHEEGGVREWSVLTRGFTGENGRVKKLHAVRVEVQLEADGRRRVVDVPGSEFEIEADLFILAIGFAGSTASSLVDELGVALDARGNVAVDAAHRTSVDGIFAAGDMNRGASLIVWAIREGQDAATAIEAYLEERAPSIATGT
jgi:glutamate synthase (NADPH) small chain